MPRSLSTPGGLPAMLGTLQQPQHRTPRFSGAHFRSTSLKVPTQYLQGTCVRLCQTVRS